MMQTGVTDTERTVRVMQNIFVKMGRRNQERKGHLEKSIITLRSIAVYVGRPRGRQVIINEIYGLKILPPLLHDSITTMEPLYSVYHWFLEKMSAIERCPL